jgi:hypothetical protein
MNLATHIEGKGESKTARLVFPQIARRLCSQAREEIGAPLQ